MWEFEIGWQRIYTLTVSSGLFHYSYRGIVEDIGEFSKSYQKKEVFEILQKRIQVVLSDRVYIYFRAYRTDLTI